MCLHFLFKSVFHKLRHKFLSGFVNSFPDYVVPFTHTFADHSSVITKCWGFELQNGKSSLKSPQTLAAQGFAPASFSSMNDKMNDPTQFEQVDETYGLSRVILRLKSLDVTAFLRIDAPWKIWDEKTQTTSNWSRKRKDKAVRTRMSYLIFSADCSSIWQGVRFFNVRCGRLVL